MAWIVVVPPSPRHPHERYQVCYRDGTRQRSAGIFPTKRRAEAEQRALERGRAELVVAPEVDLEKARTLFGEYVAAKWWPAWKDQHPTSEYGTRKKVEKRILPAFGNIALGDLDPSTIGAWKAAMVAEQLSPQTVNTYLSLLGTILNAAVDERPPAGRPGGTDRPCSGPGWHYAGRTRRDTLPPTTNGRDSCGIPQGSAGRHQPGIRQGDGVDGEAAVLQAAELHGDLVDGRLDPGGDYDERKVNSCIWVGIALLCPSVGVRLVVGLLTAAGDHDLHAERDGLSGLYQLTSA